MESKKAVKQTTPGNVLDATRMFPAAEKVPGPLPKPMPWLPWLGHRTGSTILYAESCSNPQPPAGTAVLLRFVVLMFLEANQAQLSPHT